MDNNRRGRLEPLSARRLTALLFTILALAVVVVAASRPGDAGPAAPPTSAETGAAVIRAVVILFAIGEAGVLALIIWALWPSGGRRRIQTGRGTLLLGVVSFLQSAAAIVLFWYYLHFRATARGSSAGLFPSFGTPPSLPSIPDGRGSAGAGQEWVTALIVVAVLVVASGFVLRGVRFRKRRSPLAELAGQLQEAVDESLAELEADSDPRRAVIAAYGRMERALARVGMPRARHEAALEYLDRLLGLLDARGPAARRLTELFQVAKFSDHVVDTGMQREAIAALVELRHDLDAVTSEPDPAGRALPA